MKKLFFSAIPICLVSYILFGISIAILDTKSYRGGANSGSYSEVIDYGMVTYIDETVSNTGKWILTDVMPNVTLQTSGVKAYVIQSADEFIHLYVNSPNGNNIAVKAECDSGTLELEVHPPEITFGDIINFGQILWNEDIFHGSPSAEAVIAFPKLIYDSLEIQHGSGTLMVDGFNASNNDFDIGSGRFEFSKSDQYTAEYFDIDIGSGSVVMSNMRTRGYKINIGSGKFDISGLRGDGCINMGSGKGNIAYDEQASRYSGVLDMGSGNLTVFLPDEYGCVLGMEIGSGIVDVDAYNKKATFKDDDYTELGNSDGSGSTFEIDMGSGKVNIRNTSTYTMPEMFEGRPDNVEELGMIKGIVIDGSGEWSTNFSTSHNAAEQIPPEYSYSIVDQVTITSGGPLSSSSSSQERSGNASGNTSLPVPPEAPQAPSAPDAPAAPSAPETPLVPEITEEPAA